MIDKTKLELRMLFDSREIWILEKPAGLACQGGEGIKFSLEDLIRQDLYEEPYLVHRLDKDTSGLILVAKSSAYASKFSTYFKQNLIEKRYKAIVVGKFPKSLIINDDIVTKGKTQIAHTEAKLVKHYGNFSLITLKITTGRMHQIRKHLQLRGYAIVGDDKYGNFALNRYVKKELNNDNLMLQAYFMAIPKDRIEATLELPKYFESFLKEAHKLIINPALTKTGEEKA